MPPRQAKARINAREKREKAVKMKLDGYSLSQIARAVGYASTGAASAAITEYLKSSPPEDLQEARAIERLRLESMRLGLVAFQEELLKILHKGHVVIQHGKVVGRFAGWKTDPDDPQIVLRDADDKPIPTWDEIEDDDPSIRVLAELRQNMIAQKNISESLRRLDGLDKPVVIRIEDEDGLDEEIETLVGQLNDNLVGPPLGHEG